MAPRAKSRMRSKTGKAEKAEPDTPAVLDLRSVWEEPTAGDVVRGVHAALPGCRIFQVCAASALSVTVVVNQTRVRVSMRHWREMGETGVVLRRLVRTPDGRFVAPTAE